MRFNPAASFDAGTHLALVCWDRVEYTRVEDVCFDQATMDFAYARFEREHEEWERANQIIFDEELAASFVEEPLPL